jgi:hypothetical protein
MTPTVVLARQVADAGMLVRCPMRPHADTYCRTMKPHADTYCGVSAAACGCWYAGALSVVWQVSLVAQESSYTCSSVVASDRIHQELKALYTRSLRAHTLDAYVLIQ